MATAEVNGTRLAYSDIGSGVPLLCLHGGMGIDAGSLRVPGILDLARHGIRLIIPDQRGHGESSSGKDAEYTHGTWAADARGLAQHLGLPRFALLGHSYGGFLALEYAARWPRSLTHLILVATSAGPVRVRADVFPGEVELREYFREAWPRFFQGEDKHWEVFDASKFSAEAYNAAFTRELPAYDLRNHAADIDVPMLLIVGKQDAYLPHMEWLAKHARKSMLCVLEDVGHFPFLESPEEFQMAVVSFLFEKEH
jgi:proline iminopeptidase